MAFLEGEAAALPLADKSADVLLSVFGVIFRPLTRKPQPPSSPA